MRVHYGKPKENYGVSVHRGKEQRGESSPKKKEKEKEMGWEFTMRRVMGWGFTILESIGVWVHLEEKSNGVRVHLKKEKEKEMGWEFTMRSVMGWEFTILKSIGVRVHLEEKSNWCWAHHGKRCEFTIWKQWGESSPWGKGQWGGSSPWEEISSLYKAVRCELTVVTKTAMGWEFTMEWRGCYIRGL